MKCFSICLLVAGVSVIFTPSIEARSGAAVSILPAGQPKFTEIHLAGGKFFATIKNETRTHIKGSLIVEGLFYCPGGGTVASEKVLGGKRSANVWPGQYMALPITFVKSSLNSKSFSSTGEYQCGFADLKLKLNGKWVSSFKGKITLH